MNPKESLAPAPHEIELSLFGRGYGESALIHLGSEQWVLIDSLRTAQGNPAPLVYLNSLGVNPAKALRYIIATHWHDDHVAGISEIFSQCPDAHMAIPAAMAMDEWRAFRRSVTASGSEKFSSGVAELERVAVLRRELNRPAFIRANANRLLVQTDGSAWAHGLSVEIRLLSPSDHDIEAFHARLAAMSAPLPVARVPSFPRNDLSVATWISIGEHRMLLGADLEVTGDLRTGWDAILQSAAQPQGRPAGLFKIAHHGSANGHHADVWSRYLKEKPHAALAPFSRAPLLPRQSDVDRIVELTPNAFTTGSAGRKAKNRDVAVERTIRENGHRLRAKGQVGQVRFRIDPRNADAEWSVELIGGASRMSHSSAA